MVTRTKFFQLASQVGLFCLLAAPLPIHPSFGQSLGTAEVAAQLAKFSDSNQRETAIKSFKKLGKPAAAVLLDIADEPKANLKIRLAAIAALGEMGSDADAAVPTLAKFLRDPKREIRLKAVDALASLGSSAKAAVPELTAALKDSDEALRLGAANTLGKIGIEAKSAVPALVEALEDTSNIVRLKVTNALANMGLEAESAVPALIEAMSDPDQEVQMGAIGALGRIGVQAKPAIPELTRALTNPNSRTRVSAMMALSNIGAGASDVVPELIKSLTNTERDMRSFAAIALGRIGPQAKAAVPHLINALQDSDKDVRSSAASALGRIGVDSQSALPVLTKALQDDHQVVRLGAMTAVSSIAGSLQDKATTLKADDLQAAIDNLEKAIPTLQSAKTPVSDDALKSVQRSLSVLKITKESRWFERVAEWIRGNPAVATALLYVISLPSFWALVLLIRPLLLLRINDALKPYTDFAIPMPLGDTLKVPLRFVLFVGFFHYHPRVLDAWVSQQVDLARDAFARKSTVSERKVYIPIPVVMDGNAVAELGGKDLQVTFSDGRQCLLIWGEGGIGKTSLACHLAKWAMSDDKTERLCRHRMLPVLIEQELDFKVAQDKTPFREAIRGQLQALIDSANPISDEFLERLLRQRRILVIVDRFSELSEATRQEIRPGHPNFPANALIVTSRVDETLDEVPKTTVKPMRIEGNRLSSFLEAYLIQCNKRELFTDPEYFDACSQLSKMVGQRNITVLLAKLYAEQMIARKEGNTTEFSTQLSAPLPDNIPDLMLSYLNELNRDVAEDEPDNPTVHEDAKIVAWECLRQNYRPSPAKREAVLAEMETRTGADAETIKNRLKHLEKRLRIIHTVGPAQDLICFALDPLAECLAALHLVDLYADQQPLWDEWLAQADEMPGAPEAIQGFLMAMRDCCLTRSHDITIPDHILDELGKRVGLSPETLRRAQIEQRIKHLTPRLAASESQIRLEAIRELGEMGSPAKAVLPALVREFHDRDWQIRREVTRAIGNIGPEARAAIGLLVDRLRDSDRRVSTEAIASLGKLGSMSIPTLVSALESEHPYIRSSAAWVLSSFNFAASSAVPALTAALKDEDWQVRWVAAYALGCIGPDAKSAIPVLIEAFRGEYELVAKEASRSLWRISGEAETIVTALGGDRELMAKG
jgi:HEAT repeat protein